MKRNRAELQVHLAYDREADVWFIAKSDIPGLSLEADTPAELLRRIVEAAPELVELNAGSLPDAARMQPVREGNQVAPTMNGRRAPIVVRPVFDAPLELACA